MTPKVHFGNIQSLSLKRCHDNMRERADEKTEKPSSPSVSSCLLSAHCDASLNSAVPRGRACGRPGSTGTEPRSTAGGFGHLAVLRSADVADPAETEGLAHARLQPNGFELIFVDFKMIFLAFIWGEIIFLFILGCKQEVHVAMETVS